MHSPASLFICLLVTRIVRCNANADAAHAAANTVVQALSPSGIRISVPDSPGVNLVVINGNINLPIDMKEQGQLTGTIIESKNGYWILEDKSTTVKVGDVLFFWIYLSINNSDQRSRGNRIIKAVVDPSCEPSPTTVNEMPACRGQLIFEENFDTFNPEVWKHTIQFSGDPDLEFTIYDDKPENRFTNEGLLHLAPTVLDVETITKPMKLEGCTWTREGPRYCERKPIGWDILPGARSAWVNTKDSFAFKYGRIEIRARAAAGDWILSKAWLEPRLNTYGPYPFDSGRITMMCVRGNENILEPDGKKTGAWRTTSALGIATCYRVLRFKENADLHKGELYSDGMHVYSAMWTPEKISLSVDGNDVLTTRVPEGGFLKHDFFKNCDHSPWNKGDLFAPFDKEFYINFAVQVGGIHDFVDNSTSNGNVKPWKYKELKMDLNFWQARKTWGPTWKSNFEIDSIKVWAL